MTTPSLFSTPPLQQPAPQPAAPVATATVPAAPAPGSPSGSGQNLFTIEDVKRAVPQHLRASVTQGMADMLNNISADPIVLENIRSNFVGYSLIMKEGKFKTEDYISAVTYVSFKLMGYNNEDAYARTFPQRYAALLARNASKKDIAAYVSAFHRGKLVNLIMEQSLMPTWVVNQDLHQKALNRLADLMVNANSEKVQADAAIGLLNALKKPEAKGDFQINLNQNESSGMKEMREAIAQLAQQQRAAIENGQMKTIDVAGSTLINKSEAEDVE
ncbi:hypothetical protein [Brucella anthropi]|uniref:hypothetical protein n=1 Tax=Brucella anthropi TaxID=529 RepID=UPI001AED06E5|nr:hypothetical protein [Brucella anthropi]